eukprot:GHVR01041494.1.p1 GENE.GHVR01041494.1~~GHVR01041494.1.p1  ORF type:complete len:388 (-),score=106.40 GHVR01041494.1:410-1573(-)
MSIGRRDIKIFSVGAITGVTTISICLYINNKYYFKYNNNKYLYKYLFQFISYTKNIILSIFYNKNKNKNNINNNNILSKSEGGSTPDGCPGVNSSEAGSKSACFGCPNQKICASGEANKVDPAIEDIRRKLAGVKHKFLILSGKGGVGKSTVAAQLAWCLSERGMTVGLLDIDICGPSIPRMMGVTREEVHRSADGWSPVYVNDRLSVMSIGFLLPSEDDPIIWRGPKKNGIIRQFLTDVCWGVCDVLIIDTPPGTSDEHLSIVTLLKGAHIDGALLVTTPQEISLQDVRKEINFCKKTGLHVLGVIENMSGGVFIPSTGGATAMSSSMNVPFLCSIPIDTNVALACEHGKSVVQQEEGGVEGEGGGPSSAKTAFSLLCDIVQNFCK